MGTKSVDAAIVERVASVLEKVLKRDFPGPGGQRRAARAIGISQAQISNLVNRKPGVGVGLPVAIAVRNYTGMTLDELLGLGAAARAPAEDASLEEVLAHYVGRWDDLAVDWAALRRRDGPPAGGWKEWLDKLSPLLREGATSPQPPTGAVERPRRKGKSKRLGGGTPK